MTFLDGFEGSPVHKIFFKILPVRNLKKVENHWCKGQQRLESFGRVIGRESKRKKSYEDAPDQETAQINEVLNVSESSPGNDIEVSNVNLVSNSSDANDDVSKVVL